MEVESFRSPTRTIETVVVACAGSFNAAALDDLLVYRPNENHLATELLDKNGLPRRETWRMMSIQYNVDARLCAHDGRIFMSTSYTHQTWGKDDVELRTLTVHADGQVDLKEVGKFQWMGRMQRQRCEKNWIPFSHGGCLYFVYSLEPHRILLYDESFEAVRLEHETTCGGNPTLRLSTTPVLLGDGRFLSTWHTPEYDFGFYTFRAQPPFDVLQIGRTILTAKDSTGKNVRGNKHQCIFLQSMALSEDRLVLYGGNNDHSVIRVTLPLAEALTSLAPATSDETAGTGGAVFPERGEGPTVSAERENVALVDAAHPQLDGVGADGAPAAGAPVASRHAVEGSAVKADDGNNGLAILPSPPRSD
jgi:hypothetical protein